MTRRSFHRRAVCVIAFLALLIAVPVHGAMAMDVPEAAAVSAVSLPFDAAGTASADCCAPTEADAAMGMSDCAALCGSSLLPPVYAEILPMAAKRTAPPIVAAGLGHEGSPEPYPPRTLILT